MDSEVKAKIHELKILIKSPLKKETMLPKRKIPKTRRRPGTAKLIKEMDEMLKRHKIEEFNSLVKKIICNNQSHQTKQLASDRPVRRKIQKYNPNLLQNLARNQCDPDLTMNLRELIDFMTKWSNNNAMLFFLRQKLDENLHCGFEVTNPNFINKQTVNGLSKWVTTAERRDGQIFDFLDEKNLSLKNNILHATLYENHWFLLCMDRKSKKCWTFDSLAPENEHIRQQRINEIRQDVLPTFLKKPAEAKKWNIYVLHFK